MNIKKRCEEIKRRVGSDATAILMRNGFTAAHVSGNHGPCPFGSCGGTDRARFFRDGGHICNQCGTCGDFIEAIKKLNGWTIVQTVEILEGQLNITHNGNQATAQRINATESETDGDKADGSPEVTTAAKVSGEDLERFQDLAKSFHQKFTAYGETTDNPMAKRLKRKGFERFAANKPPIKAEDVEGIGAKYGSYLPGTPYSLECVAVPGYLCPNDPGPTGWILRRVDGELFPAYGNSSASKTRLIAGSKDCWTFAGGWEAFQSASEVWCFEGWPDLAAALPHLPKGIIGITNLCGAKSTPKNLHCLFGKRIVRFADSDKPGIEGAEKFAAKVKPFADSVKVVIVPYEVTDDQGKDVRDFLAEGRPFSELLALVEQASEYEKSKKKSREKTGAVGLRPTITGPNEAVDDPHRLARLFMNQNYTLSNGLQKLSWWQGGYWQWDGLRWQELKKHELIAKLTACIKGEFDRINIAELEDWEPKDGDEHPPEVLQVTKGLLNNVDNAVASIVAQPDSLTMPDWLCGDPPFPAREVLATTKTLLHLPSLFGGKPAGISPTPMLFSANCLKYDYDPAATCPNWMKFVDSIWLEDFDSIRCLQEWFGYLLLPDTRQHKLLMLIGPPRSGKGTIVRVLQELLGEGNVASPTLSSLAGPFGLWPMLNKFVALIPDARLSGRDDSVAVVERILSITGEDPQDIHRKNMPTLTGVRMPVRFVLLSNELPNMKDASGAFMTRVNLLRMTQSFVGREDRSLGARLRGELPGILNWSIEGWRRLNERGHFVQPSSADELLSDLENLSSPILQFIADCCHTGPEFETSIEVLFRAWQSWCDVNHRDHIGTNQTFGKDLRAALPQLNLVQRRDGDQRERKYSGIRVKLDW